MSDHYDRYNDMEKLLSTNLAEVGTDMIFRWQAIDALCHVDEYNGRSIEAIRQLPSAQPEIKQQAINSSDCIDRRAALDALRVMQTYKLFAGDDMLLIDQAGAQTELMLLPSAQPERIKGHWIKISPANIYECSECGKHVMTNDICAYDFCHGCGTDMRGER